MSIAIMSIMSIITITMVDLEDIMEGTIMAVDLEEDIMAVGITAGIIKWQCYTADNLGMMCRFY